MYNCVCGDCFDSAQKFNSHKRACEQHMFLKYGSLDRFNEIKDVSRENIEKARAVHSEQTKKHRQLKIDLWVSEKHTCERCGKIMTEKFGSGRFCSRACANTRNHSDATIEKIRQSTNKFYSSALDCVDGSSANYNHNVCCKEYLVNPNKCSVCGVILPYDRRSRKTCGDTNCLQLAFMRAGRNSAATVYKRSKNEIAFCSLCENYFGAENVLHNEPIFNGWDADVILVDQKLAILWNGPWHYTKLTEKHSLEQVQNRDRIKINEIIACGYTPYVIKDLSKACSSKVQEEFDKLLKYLTTSN